MRHNGNCTALFDTFSVGSHSEQAQQKHCKQHGMLCQYTLHLQARWLWLYCIESGSLCQSVVTILA